MPVSLAFGGGDSESDRRIRELLDEGQTAYDAGDPQGAIDSWSRIFLIDIDHQEASRRIESARKLKAESERQAEEIFHDGLAQLEAGDAAGARRAFQRVLEIQPGYFAAREYLQQLDAGTVPPARSMAPVIAEPVIPLPSSREVSGHDLQQEILVPPEPFEMAAPAEQRPVKKRSGGAARDSGRARRLFLLVGGAVLLLALAGAWFLLQHREQLFPNSQEAEATPPPAAAKPATDPISRAERLHKAGRTTTAVSQLKRIPPNDPHYAKAQALIAQWTGGTAPGAPGAAGAAATPGTATGVVPAALTAETSARRAALLAAAQQASAQNNYIRALSRLEQADALAKLDGAEAQLLADTRTRLAPLANQIDLFRQHEWEHALPDLWRMHDTDPANRDITQLIVDSYYNLAVRDLQRADAKKATENLKEAINLQKDDELLTRHYLFAQTYQERPKDLLYRIYVKYLPYR